MHMYVHVYVWVCVCGHVYIYIAFLYTVYTHPLLYLLIRTFFSISILPSFPSYTATTMSEPTVANQDR